MLSKSKEIKKSMITIDKSEQILFIELDLGLEIKIKFEDVIDFDTHENSEEEIKSIKSLDKENKKGKNN